MQRDIRGLEQNEEKELKCRLAKATSGACVI